MNYKFEFTSKVEKNLSKLDRYSQQKILSYIDYKKDFRSIQMEKFKISQDKIIELEKYLENNKVYNTICYKYI